VNDWQPTLELRWLELSRDLKVLQQKWWRDATEPLPAFSNRTGEVIGYTAGFPTRLEFQWRNVPTVERKDA
jgi:hypothetical protein